MVRPRIHDEATADALLEAAGELLATGGPDAVTVRQVAADVGVSTRAVYSLFGSRENLLAGLSRRGFEGLRDALTEQPPGGDPLADLRTMGEAYRRSARERPNLYPAMFQWTDVHPDTSSGESADTTFGILVETVQRCLDADLLVGDARLLARQLWGLTHGLVLLEAQGALGDDPDEVWDHALRAIATGNAGPALRG